MNFQDFMLISLVLGIGGAGMFYLSKNRSLEPGCYPHPDNSALWLYFKKDHTIDHKKPCGGTWVEKGAQWGWTKQK